jgi:hypothetical protein
MCADIMSVSSARPLGGGAAVYHARNGRVPSPQGAPPPLPDGLAPRAREGRAGLRDAADATAAPPARALRGGCYLARYTPLQVSPTQPGSVYYLGTLRVQVTGGTFTISGDLYLRRIPSPSSPAAPPEPDPGAGIPVFPRQDYRYYLRSTDVSGTTGSPERCTLELELFRFNSAMMNWSNDGAFRVDMAWTTTPPGFPSGADYLTGELKSAAGAVAGSLALGWVSPFLRRATVEIDRVSGGVVPRDNGSGLGWRDVFAPIGWDVTVVESDANVQEPSGESWSDNEMHAAMTAWRDRRDNLLDLDWWYHLLCVRRIDETERGIMYDASATDSNNTPREGVGLACEWVYTDDAVWGDVRGTRFGSDASTYFRTAIHELGHALGLYHNAADNGYMNTTDVIARRARPDRPFPRNIRWGFHPDDEKRLGHMPDNWVRPGGIQFGEDYSVAPISADDLIETPDGLRLDVRALSEVLPLGAPARVEFALVNVSDVPQLAPLNLSLRGGTVRGKVIDPAGTVRSFLPLVQCLDSQPVAPLAPGGEVSHSATVIRGPQGALFPTSGLYRILVEVQWEAGGIRRGLTGAADLLVTAPTTSEHAQAAYEILSTPDTLLTIAASSSAAAGVQAIDRAANDPTLAPHYAWLDAKRVCRTGDPASSLAALQRLSAVAPVMSSAERRKAATVLDRVEGAAAAPRGAAMLAAPRAGAGDESAELSRLAAQLRTRFLEP